MNQKELLDLIKKDQKERTDKNKPSIINFLKNRAVDLSSRRLVLKRQLAKAGLGTESSKISRFMFILCIIVNIGISIYAINRFSGVLAYNYIFLIIMFIVLWVFVFFLVMFIMWLLFYLTLDLAIFKRKQRIEEVLPDFLQLASSNIRAGMTIDQALWFAVRPRFGVLAKEIEEVAKRTLSGERLEEALEHFVKKYESKVLERSMSILIEGIRSGGEVGYLMSKISSNIQEMNLLKKEMAANVTTYVIFISFATVVAAPFLFGLATQLISIIQEVFTKIDLSPGSGVSVGGEGGISLGDFRMFAVLSLIISSFFSAIIISTIQKGSIKAGIKYIPMFIVASVTLFLLISKAFAYFMGGFF